MSLKSSSSSARLEYSATPMFFRCGVSCRSVTSAFFTPRDARSASAMLSSAFMDSVLPSAASFSDGRTSS